MYMYYVSSSALPQRRIPFDMHPLDNEELVDLADSFLLPLFNEVTPSGQEEMVKAVILTDEVLGLNIGPDPKL